MTIITALPLGHQHMPRDYAISLASYTSRGTSRECRIPTDFGPSQSMRGFESTYRNIIDYIVRITYRIWEDREVGYILNTYHESAQVFDDFGLQHGAEKIVGDTMHTTAAFSDIKLIADEIVWAGNDEIGFHTSHRTIIRGTNDGASKYGPATGSHIDVWCIANCVALDNRIFLEHVLYNNSSLLKQLGFDLKEMAIRLSEVARSNSLRRNEIWEALRSAARLSQPLCTTSPIEGFDVDHFVRSSMERIWGNRTLAEVAATHDENVAFHGPTGRAEFGREAYLAFIDELLNAFPDLLVQVDEVYWMGNDMEGYLTSERWSATGTHKGTGIYGMATGRTVRIWGITQHKIINRRIVEVWTMFNELDLMMQLFAKN